MMRVIGQQGGLPFLVVGGHASRVEAVVGSPVAVPTAQDGGPGQARLGAFQAEHLEEPPFVMDGSAPLLIVVGDHERVVARPAAAGHPCGRDEVAQ